MPAVRERDGCADGGRVETERVRLDVGEDRGGAGHGDRVGGRGEGEGRDDHLVTGTDAGSEQPEVQRARAGVDRHTRAARHQGGELLLEGGDLLALHESPAAQDCGDGRRLLVAHVDADGADAWRRVPGRCSVMVPSLAQVAAGLDEQRAGDRALPLTVPGLVDRRRPAGPTQPIRRAGVPATSAKSGTSCTTTAPAATIAHRPTSTGATQTARAPTEHPWRRVTPTGSQWDASTREPSGWIARGYWSLVRTAAGPMNTPSSTTAGS